jgi:uracil-DNA glycosylase
MSISPDDELRGAIARYLETDTLLGVKAAPLAPPSVAPPARPALTPRSPIRDPRSEIRNQPPAVPPSLHPSVPASLGSSSSVPRVMNVPPEDLAARQATLRALDEGQVRKCVKCKLCETRKKTVFGQGHAAPRIVFVGEAPGADEDAQGLAFVGRAGQLLTQMIAAMGLSRDEVFICNILKCRPPGNRTPAPDEISACWPYLDEQLRVLQPEVIVALGAPASQTLLRTTESIGRLRGQWHEYYTSGSPMIGQPTPLMPTFHPAYLLRSPGEKGKAWSDLKTVMQRLGLPLPPSQTR